ncbi:MAG: AAA family ATPase [Solirubrobacterales bacterium]|nr:AAA family ATPase [Solirubrobacterales bacterium]
MTVTVVASQKGGVGKTTTAINVGILLARAGQRVLAVDADPQIALTRQVGIEARSLGLNLVDVLAGRADARNAIVGDVHGVDVLPGAPQLTGVEMALVGELGRERFLLDALEPVRDSYDAIVIDTPPNLGLLTVNALTCAQQVLAPVSGEDEASVHGVIELRGTIKRLCERLARPAPELIVVLTRWQPYRISCRAIEKRLIDVQLAPTARVRARSAAIARAAASRSPLVVSDPDSSAAIGYARLIEQLAMGAGR